MRKRRHNRLSQYASRVSLWAMRLRYFWYRLNKTPLIVTLVLLIVGGGAVFALYAMSVEARDRRALTCLALNVYFEARGEPENGQYAVAEVTMNRVASPYYPDSVCAVVYQKNWDVLRNRYVSAFSWTEFSSVPSPRGKEWARAQEIARDVYYQRRPPELPGALHYHAHYVAPSWARQKRPIASIGNHRFYK